MGLIFFKQEKSPRLFASFFVFKIFDSKNYCPTIVNPNLLLDVWIVAVVPLISLKCDVEIATPFTTRSVVAIQRLSGVEQSSKTPDPLGLLEG